MSSKAHTMAAHFKSRRLASGLSQVEAARAAGIGRSTLIHFENGRKDIRLSNAVAIAAAVGASLRLEGGSSEGLERLRLRHEESQRLAARRAQHLALAVDLALRKPAALRALAEARRMVRLWKAAGTCSERYIVEWSRVLLGPPAQVARKIRHIDPEWLDALLQNTPFPAMGPTA